MATDMASPPISDDNPPAPIAYDEALENLRKYELDSNVTHLDVAIASLRELLDGAKRDASTAVHSMSIPLLGRVLCRRYEHCCAVADIEDALFLLEEALPQPEHADLRIPILTQLSEALLLSFENRGNSAVLDNAVRTSHEAVQLCSRASADYCATLHMRACVLRILHRETGSLEHLEESVCIAREGLQCCTDHFSHDPLALRVLGRCLTEMYMLTGMMSDSEASEKALLSSLGLCPVGHPNRIATLSDTGYCYLMQWYTKHELSCIERAQPLLDEACSICPVGHSAQGLLLIYLMICSSLSRDYTQDINDHNKAIEYARTALASHPIGHPNRWSSLNGLAVILCAHQNNETDLNTLEEAIDLHHQALSLCPPTHARYRQTLTNIAYALSSRYRLLGHIDDLERIIAYRREILKHYEAGHVFRSDIILWLAGDLQEHFHHLGSNADLEEALVILEDLLSILDKDSAHMGQTYSLLGNICLSRFETYGAQSELDKAIKYLEEAVELRQYFQSDIGTVEMMLGRCYGARYTLTGNRQDVDTAVSYLDQAISRYPKISFRHIQFLLIHADLQIQRGDPPHSSLSLVCKELHNKGTGAWSLLAPVPPLLQHLEEKGMLYFKEHPEIAARVLDIQSAILPLLTEVAFMGMDITLRLSSLTRYDAIFASTISYGRASGRLKQALEILEHSRSVFWRQALNLRAPMDELPTALRMEMLALIPQLERGTFPVEKRSSTSTSDHIPSFRLDVLEISEQQRKRGNQLRILLEKIRESPGLERFMQHDEFSALKQTANDGPVVVLVHSSLSCEAMILNQDGKLSAIALQAVTQDQLRSLSESWETAVVHARNAIREESETERLSLAKTNKTKRFIARATRTQGHVLQELWRKVVQPVLVSMDLQKSTGRDRPRLWWCCSGLFASLPVHAACDSHDRCSDYVVSSYTPTLGALLRARKDFVPPRRDEIKILLNAASTDDLPITAEEVRIVSGIVPKTAHISLPPAGATVDDILQNVPNAHILHLACHGIQDAKEPLNSGFILQDGKLTIARLMPVPLPRAFFAFMSACETAKGDARYSNQTIHLGAAMLFAGFRSAVGTMWSMDDVDGPVVAKTVYERLFEGESEELEPSAIPYALDEAVQILRERGHPPGRWATYIHLGM